MDDTSTVLEFFMWLVVVVLVFYVINEYVGLKRFASVIIAALIASIVIFFAFHGNLFGEIALSASLIVLALFGLTAALRQKRSDFTRGSTSSDELKCQT
jgi:hypothetical protein